MQVEADVPFGPVVDDRVLKFHTTIGTYKRRFCSRYSQKLPVVPVFSFEDFATDVGNDVIGLPLFSVSSREITYRKSYSALKAVIDKAADAPRLFFKYWCLPRLSMIQVRGVLASRKEDWRQDQSLLALIDAVTADD
jgi:hypothetical protein